MSGVLSGELLPRTGYKSRVSKLTKIPKPSQHHGGASDMREEENTWEKQSDGNLLDNFKTTV